MYMKEQRLYLHNYHNPELIRELLTLMGIMHSGSDDDEDGIYNGASVYELLKHAERDFSSIHDMLHTAIFFYFQHLFENALPAEILEFSLTDKENQLRHYRIPKTVITQSSWLSEVLILSFDQIYRRGANTLPAPFAKEVASTVNADFGLKEFKDRLSKVEFGPIVSLERAVLRVAAVTILLSEKPMSERSFGITATHDHEVREILVDLYAIMKTRKGDNYEQLKKLVSRIAFVLRLASDVRSEGGLDKLSFHSWLSQEYYELRDISGEQMQAVVQAMELEIKRDLAAVGFNN
jgi:hypothetical protein